MLARLFRPMPTSRPPFFLVRGADEVTILSGNFVRPSYQLDIKTNLTPFLVTSSCFDVFEKKRDPYEAIDTSYGSLAQFLLYILIVKR